MMFKTILTPIEFSRCSYGVARHAAELASTHGASLVFLYVLEDAVSLWPELTVQPHPVQGRVFRAAHLRAEALRLMGRYQAIAEEVGAETEVLVRVGRIGECILEVSEEIDADLIVMGTHGRSGLTRVLLGSVAEEVLRESTVPVMTYRTLHKDDCHEGRCATCASGVVWNGVKAELVAQ